MARAVPQDFLLLLKTKILFVTVKYHTTDFGNSQERSSVPQLMQLADTVGARATLLCLNPLHLILQREPGCV